MTMFAVLASLAYSIVKEATGYRDTVLGTFRVVDGIHEDGVCWATWENSTATDGWYKYTVHSSNSADKYEQAMCAGYLEGYMAHDSIYQSALLLKETTGLSVTRDDEYPDNFKEWMNTNIAYIEEKTSGDNLDEYWTRIAIIYKIFLGLVAGYEKAEEGNPPPYSFKKMDLWVVQCTGDLGDVLPNLKLMDLRDWHRARCTAGIRLLPDYSDIYVMHNAWSDVRLLHASLVKYNLAIDEFSAKSVMISTRLGMIGSLDDFYIADTGLITFETSIMNANHTYGKGFIVPRSVPCWMRALMAQFVATSSEQWTELFIQENSGTYNNDYYITDTKKLQPGVKPTKDLVWIIEQTPSNVLGPDGKYKYRKDLTQQLVEEGFLASFNVPYWKEIEDIMNYSAAAKEGNPMFISFFDNPRYKISKKLLTKVSNFDMMKKYSRYNNYTLDPDALGNPVNTIAARGDLGDIDYQLLMCALDAKIAKGSEVFTKMHIHAINSPAYDDVPAFDFTKLPEEFKDMKHDGLADHWEFPWSEFDGNHTDVCNQYNTDAACVASKFCGWCGETRTCMAGNTEGPFFGLKCESGWSLVSWNWPAVGVCLSILGAVVVILVIFLLIFKKQEPELKDNDVMAQLNDDGGK